MDLSKIFRRDACPTKIGGQAVMEGIMMRGDKKTALAMRLPTGKIKIDVTKTKEQSKWAKVPLVRGVVTFVGALVQGTRILMKSAEVLEEFDDEEYEPSRFEMWIETKFGSKAAWNFMLYSAVVIAIVFTVGIFIILPTGVVSVLKLVTDSIFWLNFAEGFVRIALFVLYAWAISFMGEIKRVFQFHGAEHKTIHCFECGLELTPENCRQFPTLHPRCGTSFLMFVFIIAFALHFLMGWPNLFLRIVSRLLLLPIIAGLSYELLKWAGRSDNVVVKVLSVPGLLLQKITTKEPDDSQLEVAIAALNAVREDMQSADIGDPADAGSGAPAGAGADGKPSRGRAACASDDAGAPEEAQSFDDGILPIKPRLRRRRFI